MNHHLLNQEPHCLPLFEPISNDLESAAVRFRKAFTSGPEPVEQSPTKHQQGVQAKVIAHLKQHRGIDALTVQKLGTTDARKIFCRLRDKGYLFTADDPAGHEERPNASGQGTYRWHRWTGKQ